MNNELIQAALDLLAEIADHNGNVYAQYSELLPYKYKVRLNRKVKKLFTETQKAAQQCQTKDSK